MYLLIAKIRVQLHGPVLSRDVSKNSVGVGILIS